MHCLMLLRINSFDLKFVGSMVPPSMCRRLAYLSMCLARLMYLKRAGEIFCPCWEHVVSSQAQYNACHVIGSCI